jgi:hypothetical protein
MVISVPVAASGKSNAAVTWETELAVPTVEALVRMLATSSEYV